MKGAFAGMLSSKDFSDSARNFSFATYDVPGSTRTRLLSLNDRGQIVGDYRDAAGRNHGLLLTDGVPVMIDVPGSTSTTVHGINNYGSLVGYWTDAAGAFHGFVSDCDRITVVDSPGAVGFSRLLGINCRGEIVGDFIDSENIQHGFMLRRGVFSEFDFPGAQDTSPIAISPGGAIVGGYTGAHPNRLHGFLYEDESTEMIHFPGAINTQPLGINGRRDLVGAYDGAGGKTRGFARIGGTFITLEVRDSFRTIACGINASGRIVGNFNRHGDHGFIATPSRKFIPAIRKTAGRMRANLRVSSRLRLLRHLRAESVGRLVDMKTL